jgi:hypothetical protein
MELARSVVNDTMPGATGTSGEGQILTNSTTISPFALPFLNSAIRSIYRQLRNAGDPQLIKDNVIIAGLTPVNGAYGVGSPDPAVQVFLSVSGYFDGTNMNSTLLLPSDCMYLLSVMERLNGSSNPFVRMHQPQGGLSSQLQNDCFHDFEWRENQLYMRGAIVTRDIRLRYLAALPTFWGSNLDFANTYVPIQDSTDAIAYSLAQKYSEMLGGPQSETIAKNAGIELQNLKVATARRNQTITYNRQGFGEGGEHDGFGFAGNL